MFIHADWRRGVRHRSSEANVVSGLKRDIARPGRYMEVRNTGFAEAIDLVIGPAPRLAQASAVVHGTAAILIWSWIHPPWAAAGLSAAAIVLGVLSAYRYLRPLCSRLRVSSRGEWSLELGRWYSAQLVAAPLVLAGLTVLRLRTEAGRNVRVVLTQENAAPDPFRRLRVRLRYR